jgi:hypothetical protein
MNRGRRPVRPMRWRKLATVDGAVDLQDVVEVADVDAELERAGGDDDAVLPGLERLLGVAAGAGAESEPWATWVFTPS